MVNFPDEDQQPTQPDPNEGQESIIEIRSIRERLKVKLTPEEKNSFADELVDLLTDRSQEESELAAIRSQYKAKIDKMSAGIQEITSIMQAGFQMKEVDCSLEMDYTGGEVRKIRLDTGEVFFRRPMENAERQRGLDLGAGEVQEDPPGSPADPALDPGAEPPE